MAHIQKLSMHKRVFQVCVFLLFIKLSSQAQYHRLKFINTGAVNNPSSTPQFVSGPTATPKTENTLRQFSKVDKICVDGMWALYNTTNYGEGAEDFTTVISVKGRGMDDCTRPGDYPVLKTVQSLQYLGNADYTMDAVHIYSQAYFLGGKWDATSMTALPNTITGVAMGSLVITGSKQWLICRDKDCTSGVCVNMLNYSNLFFQRNTLRDTTVSDGWPKTVKGAKMLASVEECANYPNPVLPSRVARNADVNDNQITVLTH